MLELFKFHKINLPELIQKEINNLIDERNDSFIQYYYPADFTLEFKSTLFELMNHLLSKDNLVVGNGWLNIVTYTGIPNNLDWHNENGIGSGKTISDYPYVCTLWILGDQNKGGEFNFINKVNEVESVQLNPPGIILIKNDTLHSVNSYTGDSKRVSLNFNINFD